MKGNGTAYNEQQLVNSLSMLGQLKSMMDTLNRVTSQMIGTPATDEAMQVIAAVNRTAGRVLNLTSHLITETTTQLDTLMELKHAVKDDPDLRTGFWGESR